MQMSQLTLEPHARVILVEYEFVLTLASLLFCFIFGYLRLLLSARQRGGLRQWLRRLLGVCLPVDVPVAPSSSCISSYASATLEPILDSVVIK
jgi:hypothetical protein